MLGECIDALEIKKDGIYCDLTLGGGGHSLEIAKRLDKGRLICFDRDMDAINAAKARLIEYGDKITFVHSNFSAFAETLDALGIDKVDGVLADLGVSSYQLDNAERGFSYMNDAPLDMRMDQTKELTAYDVVNTYSEDELKRVIRDYGEENFASAIARRIVREREKEPIRTTLELTDIIKASMPQKAKQGGHHPAKRTFQAIRIEVNGELDAIPKTVRAVTERLNEGGRFAVITFHSLEDRLVKKGFAEAAEGCTCPRSFPICVCGNVPKVKIITKKPILPSDGELEVNPRSRSAKLRVCEGLDAAKGDKDE